MLVGNWRRSKHLQARLWITLLTLLTLVPFLNQAFHIDDRIYLETSQQVLEHPLYPYDYPVLFEGLPTPDAASNIHLPLTAYYLGLVQWLTGSQAEWVYHLAFLIFPWLAALAFYDLARFYLKNPLVAACLLLLAPAFSVLAHTLMTEVPLLAFWLLAISRMLRIQSDGGGRWDRVLLAAAVAAASLISLLTIGLVLLLAALIALDRHPARPSRQLWWVLLIPVVIWLLWFSRAYLHYDRLVLVNALLHAQKRSALDAYLVGLKGLSFVLNLGGTLLFPLLLWYAFRGRVKSRLVPLLGMLALVPLFASQSNWHGWTILLFVICLTSGLLVLWQWIELVKRPTAPQVLLLLWFFGIAALCLGVYYSGAVRYTLLALPPTLLLWCGAVEQAFIAAPGRARPALWLGVVLTGLYTAPIAYTDYQFAGLYRDYATQLVNRYAKPGRTIWFTAEWGCRYYLEKAGAKPLPRHSNQPREDDIILKPYLASPWVTLLDGDDYSELVEQLPAEIASPLRILDFSAQAGFYSTGWGILPFGWSTGERWEWFNVFRVKQPYAGPLPQPERHW